jgi:zinc protease
MTGATIWSLSNGIRVVVKPTTFQNDEIKFDGWQLGGTSLLSDADWDQVQFPGLISAMGVGDLDPVALQRVLAGKVVEVRVGYSELTETASGSARPADLEVMFQLLHLRMTAPHKDLRAFTAWKQEQLEWLKHRRLRPEAQFLDELRALETGNHHRHLPARADMLDKVELDKALAIYHQRFADVGSFTFVFVGNVELAKLQPLVETYLASLPSQGRKERWKDVRVNYPTRSVSKEVVAGSEPKSLVVLQMQGADKWSIDSERDARVLSRILDIRLREVLREDMGGVYGVSVDAFLEREPTQRRTFEVQFGCDPANIDKLKAAVFDEVGRIVRNGIGNDYLAKVREQLRREHETDVQENSWWLEQLRDAYYYGDDFKAATDIGAITERVTSANVQAAAKHFFTPNSYLFATLKPKPPSP